MKIEYIDILDRNLSSQPFTKKITLEQNIGFTDYGRGCTSKVDAGLAGCTLWSLMRTFDHKGAPFKYVSLGNGTRSSLT